MNRALVRLRDRNQVTLPTEVISRLGIQAGDWLELTVSNTNCVQLRPAQIVTAGTPEAERLEQTVAENLRRKNYSTFKTIEEFDHHLDKIEKTDIVDISAVSQPAEPDKVTPEMYRNLREKVMSAIEAALPEEPTTYSKVFAQRRD
jgi:bifunctional DNA-binding transcriptional regulator/antitoxin component of YhaV-PrlF toxin-antitoxin module